MKVEVTVYLKEGVLDPQGQAIESALGGLGFSGIRHVRQGKVFLFHMDPRPDAEEHVHALCKALLVNDISEEYTFEITP